MNQELTPEEKSRRLAMIRASHKRYVRARKRDEFNARRATWGVIDAAGVDELPFYGEAE